MSRGRAVGVLLALGLAACGGSTEPPQPVPTTATPVRPKAAAGKPALDSSFRFADAKEAERSLGARVAATLVGQSWLGVTPSWTVELPRGTTIETVQGNTVIVRVQPSAEHVSRWLTEFEQAPLVAPNPAQWKTEWLLALQVERARLLCQRRQALLGVHCDNAVQERDPNVAATISTLASRLVLEPNLPEGVPVDAAGVLQWQPSVKVWQRTSDGLEALAGVPLTVELSGVSQVGDSQVGAAQSHLPTSLSDAEGKAELPLPADFGSARVLAFGPGTLGPLDEYWPGASAKLSMRRLDKARAALLVERGGPETPFERSVRGQLQRTLGHDPVVVPSDLGAAVLHSQQGALPADLIARLVEATQGQLDYVARVSVDSEFASQMGNGRTWYEARAHIKVFEVWTGKVVDVFELSATESGIGDQGADAAARERLGVLVAARLQQL